MHWTYLRTTPTVVSYGNDFGRALRTSAMSTTSDTSSGAAADPGAAASPDPVVGHERGTPGYRRLGLALWCAGLATFVLVYCVQGLLPTLATEFHVSSSTSSFALSATTLGLALAVVPLAAIA